MDIQRFRKRPVVVEAIRYDPPNNCTEVAVWMDVAHEGECSAEASFTISTLEGDMEARPGDWIIKNARGEFYPCQPDIFEATYEPAP